MTVGIRVSSLCPVRLAAPPVPHTVNLVSPIAPAHAQIVLSALTACGKVAVARLALAHPFERAGGTSPMKPALARQRHEAIDHDYLMVHEWRVAQLTRLGTHGRWPRPPPTTSTGTRSPSWFTAAVRHGSRCRSSAEALSHGQQPSRPAADR